MLGRPSPEEQINVAQNIVAFWNYTKAFCEQRRREPEEILRLDAPLMIWRHIATEEVELSGVKIPKGAKLALVLGSGSHDEAYFAQPEQLDIQRPNARNHLAFGKGIHYCLGAPLARLEAKIALELFAERLPGLRLVPDQRIEYPASLSFRAPKQLLVAWDTASA